MRIMSVLLTALVGNERLRWRHAVPFGVACELVFDQRASEAKFRVRTRGHRELAHDSSGSRNAMEGNQFFGRPFFWIEQPDRGARLAARHLVGVVNEEHRALDD